MIVIILCFLLFTICFFIKDGKTIRTKREFTISEFNEWFQNEYTGYDGQIGAKGIFLRLDKLSSSMMVDYLVHLGYDEESANEESYKYLEWIRDDWRSRKKLTIN